MSGPDPREVERLLAAVYPTRLERAMGRFVSWAYEHPEGGPIDKAGDLVEVLKCRLQRRRADRKAKGR